MKSKLPSHNHATSPQQRGTKLGLPTYNKQTRPETKKTKTQKNQFGNYQIII